MLHMLGQALFGLIVGVVANYLVGGHNGLILSCIIGLVGGWIGGQLGKWLGWYQDGHAAGFLMSVVGAVLLLIVARYVL